jgi:divalent metal cation (Fe/Co/Zn/Cd) transporter
MEKSFVIKGNICQTTNPKALDLHENAYAVCVDGVSKGIFDVLPEEEQMKILNILTRYYDSYSQFHSINSHKSGDVTRIDIHLSFDKDTRVEEVVRIQKQMQNEIANQIDNCIVNIIVENS